MSKEESIYTCIKELVDNDGIKINLNDNYKIEERLDSTILKLKQIGTNKIVKIHEVYLYEYFKNLEEYEEYTINQVINLPIGTILSNGINTIKIFKEYDKKIIKILKEYGFKDIDILDEDFINSKWIIKKGIPFMEAIKQHDKGKDIYCLIDDSIYTYEYTDKSNLEMNSIESCGLSRNEILRGEWFVKEGDNS